MILCICMLGAATLIMFLRIYDQIFEVFRQCFVFLFMLFQTEKTILVRNVQRNQRGNQKP